MQYTYQKRDRQLKRSEAGISLLEVLLAVAIFAFSVASLGSMGLGGMATTGDALMRFRAALALEETAVALRSIRDRDYELLMPGTYGLSFSGGEWSLLPDGEVDDGLIRSITLTPIAPGKTRADIEISWVRAGQTNSLTATFFLHRLRGASWVQTTTGDFLSGKQNGAIVESGVGDGGVTIELRNEWTKPAEFASVDVMGTGEVTAMAESGGVLYVAVWGSAGTTIEAIDLRDAGNAVLVPIGRTQLSERVQAIVANGAYLYLATDGVGSELIALARSDLSRVQTVNLPGGARLRSLVASGTSLYAGRAVSGQPELYEFSINVPESGIPIIRVAHIAGSVSALTLHGGHLFVGTTANGEEVSVRRTLDLGVVGTLNLPGDADVTGLVFSENTLAVGRRSSGTDEILGVDATDPEALSILWSIDLPGNVTDVALGPDNRLYATSDRANGELIVVEPLTPAWTIHDISSGAGAMKLAVAGPYVYAGLQNVNPEVVSLRGGQGNWATPRLAGGTNIPGNADARAITVLGTTLWLGMEEWGGDELLSFDLANPIAPTPIGGLEFDTDLNDIVSVGNLLFLATSHNSGELRVVNAADPARPTPLGLYNAPGNQNGLSVAASGTLIALGTANNPSSGGQEIRLLSVVNPGAPILYGSAEAGGHVYSLAFTQSGFIVVATGNNAKEIMVFDARTPMLSEVASFNLPNTADATSVHVDGDMLLVLTRSSEANPDLYLLSIDPGTGALALRGSLQIGGNPSHGIILGTLAFLVTTAGGPGFTVVDIANLASPRQLGTLDLGNDATALTYFLGRVYAATILNAREVAVVEPSPPSTEYIHRGWQSSSSFDSGKSSVEWGTIDWTISGNGMVKFQIRTSSTAEGLSRALWVGAGGIIDGYFLVPGETIIPYTRADGTQWIEYRAEFVGNGAERPVLEDVTITYN